KRETRHFVRDDDVAYESELESAAEADTVDGCYRDKGCFVQPVKRGVDPFEKLAHARPAIEFIQVRRTMVKLAQIGSCAEATLLRAGKDACCGFGSELLRSLDELFQLGEHDRANLVGGWTVEHNLDDAVAPFPTQSLPLKRFHAVAFRAYMELISAS